MADKKEVIAIYQQMKKDCGNDTKTIIDFVKWLHEDKHEAVYLLEDETLGFVERNLIQNVIDGNI